MHVKSIMVQVRSTVSKMRMYGLYPECGMMVFAETHSVGSDLAYTPPYWFVVRHYRFDGYVTSQNMLTIMVCVTSS